MERTSALSCGAALIGDVVGSRSHIDRADLHQKLRAALDETNDEVLAVQGLSLTVGDEFQGLYADLGTAIHAALMVRLHLFGSAELRLGLGWGSLQIFDTPELPFAQDGPSWWSARAAIDFLKQAKKQAEVPRGWSTACSIASPSSERDRPLGVALTPKALIDVADRSQASGTAGYLNSFLLCRDELIARLTPKQARHLLTLLQGRRQSDIARAEGVSDSAVSQRAIGGGLYAILQAHRMIRSESEWSLLAFG